MYKPRFHKKTNAGTDEDFNLVIKMKDSGFSIREISKATGWAMNTIYNWVQFKTRSEYMKWMNESKARSLAKKNTSEVKETKSKTPEVSEPKDILSLLTSIDKTLKDLKEMWE